MAAGTLLHGRSAASRRPDVVRDAYARHKYMIAGGPTAGIGRVRRDADEFRSWDERARRRRVPEVRREDPFQGAAHCARHRYAVSTLRQRTSGSAAADGRTRLGTDRRERNYISRDGRRQLPGLVERAGVSYRRAIRFPAHERRHRAPDDLDTGTVTESAPRSPGSVPSGADRRRPQFRGASRAFRSSGPISSTT